MMGLEVSPEGRELISLRIKLADLVPIQFALGAAGILLSMAALTVSAAECYKDRPNNLAERRFAIQGGVVKDRYTGLLWQRCSLGQNWTGETCEAEFKKQLRSWYNWKDAVRRVSRLQQEEQYRGWRLPNKKELSMLVERNCGEPTINDVIFPNTPAKSFWTDEPFGRGDQYVWTVDFATGKANSELKDTATFHARLVKGETMKAPEEKGGSEEPSVWDDGIHDPYAREINALQTFKDATEGFPLDSRGEVDWARVLREGLIKPRAEISGFSEMSIWDHDIIYKNTRGMPHVRFPHKTHSEWLDCENCHSEIFATKTHEADISMESIYRGKHCGVCHGRVAFSPNNCERCHSVSPMVADK
ncbi:MAG: DUF1566 domain-containing protein [Porticoccus sp.]